MNFSNKIEKYLRDGLVKRNAGPHGMDLFCYTKQCFFNFGWDEITKHCRGVVYDKNGKQLSFPMPKIFNIGEVPETDGSLIQERMRYEKYEVAEKSNGHLCIVFYNPETREWYNTTKGSWYMEFVEKDRKLLEDLGIMKALESRVEIFGQYTFCFEIIAEYDKHTLYDVQRKKFGRDTAVLLTVRNAWEDKHHQGVKVFADAIGADCVEKYIFNTDLHEWYDHTNTEGYVVRFIKDDLRVKVKCNEYLNMRFKNSFEGGKQFIKVFEQYEDTPEAYNHIPEEYHRLYDHFVTQLVLYTTKRIRDSGILEYVQTLDGNDHWKCKALGLNQEFDPLIKSFGFSIIRETPFKNIMGFFKEFAEQYDFSKITLKTDNLF